ncbi:DUF4123 domain-containing protein [Paraburkholderia fungorum]|uniref:DUF4123 domain-containing protein n=1 Tax=Paraburkholderia fungorum TaxID=134537 RepID=UPI0038BCEC29
MRTFTSTSGSVYPDGTSDADSLFAGASATAVQLGEQLRREADLRGSPRVLLLTGPAMLRAFTDAQLEALKEDGVAIETIVIRHPGLDPAYCPMLVELDLDRPASAGAFLAALDMAVSDWQPQSLQNGQGHRIGAFLFSRATSGEVAAHLARVALQRRPRSGRCLLGLHDPAAFDGIWRVCSTVQRRHVLGPVDDWYVVDRWQRCSVHRRDESAEAAAESTVLSFSASQWDALANVRAINRAWIQAQYEGMPVSPAIFAKLADAMQRARSYGLFDADDLVLFAWHALSVRPDFDSHPHIRHALQNVGPDTLYARVEASLSERVWHEVRIGEAGGPGSREA